MPVLRNGMGRLPKSISRAELAGNVGALRGSTMTLHAELCLKCLDPTCTSCSLAAPAMAAAAEVAETAVVAETAAAVATVAVDTAAAEAAAAAAAEASAEGRILREWP